MGFANLKIDPNIYMIDEGFLFMDRDLSGKTKALRRN